jgi:hypothetical protein
VKLLIAILATAGLSGCMAYGGGTYGSAGVYGGSPYDGAYYDSAPVYIYGNGGYARGYRGGRDRDGDGVADRYDRDRDGDGVPNRRDASPRDYRRR